jgi:hypothetical protein
MTDATKTIAATIFQQLGGQGFARMIGLRSPILVRENKELCEITAVFQWKARAIDGVNFLEVTLVEALDTYRMVFGKVTGQKVIRQAPIEDVYCDQLQELFESRTGLIAELPRVIFECGFTDLPPTKPSGEDSALTDTEG